MADTITIASDVDSNLSSCFRAEAMKDRNGVVIFPREEIFRNTGPHEAWLKKNVVLPTATPPAARQPGYFASDMKPLFRVYRLLGIFPINMKDSGYAEFRLLCPLMLYTVFVQASMMVAAAFLAKDRLEYITKENPNFGQVLTEARYLVSVLYIFLWAVANLPESGIKAQFISSWTDYQRQYKAAVGKPLDLNLRQQMKTEALFIIVLSSVETAFMFFSLDKIKLWYTIPISYCVLSCVLNTGLWRGTGLALVTAARSLIGDLEQVLGMCEFECAEKIAEYRMLWLKLGKLTQDLGNCMGFTYGTQVIGYFFEQVMAVFGLLANMEEGFSSSNIGFVSDVIIFSWLIFVTCNTAQRATDEVGIRMQERLQVLFHKFPRRCSESRQEVRYFLEAIAENPPQINFSGFVVVNRGLQTSLMSAMVTYLVILIQFQISVDSAVNKNVTGEKREK